MNPLQRLKAWARPVVDHAEKRQAFNASMKLARTKSVLDTKSRVVNF